MQRVFYLVYVCGELVLSRKLKLIIEYKGTRYHGWQVQPNGPTIQATLQDCLKKITRENGAIVGSGRTDAGVHAEAQVAHFQTAITTMTSHQFLMAFNSLLPSDITVKNVAEVPVDFHAQRSAVRKIYRYTILNREYPSALLHDRCWYIQYPLDVKSMQRAKTYLEGRHDFSAFRASNCEARNPVREIYKISISKKRDLITFDFNGNGFLKYMVRNIVGTLVQVGRKKIKAQEVKTILESRDRRNAGPTARPYGLCLIEVFYNEFEIKK